MTDQIPPRTGVETPVRLMLADVDGTLVTQDKVLTDEAIDAVERLRKADILFAVTSGRPPRGMGMLVGPLDLQTPISAFNGGCIVDRNMKVIEQKVLPEKLVEPIVGLMRSFDLDVTHPKANKGEVARYLARHYKISSDEIATIGDQPNDVLMFAHSGLSIAMGNADPQVQRAARRVTASNQDNGFAEAVNRYVLPH